MIDKSCSIVAIEHITLDGVYQAPARADEDTRGGFNYGGWGIAGNDPQMQEVMGKYMIGGWSLLVGATTYEGLYEGWHVRQPSSPMTYALTKVQKFVVSHNPGYTLPWENSTLLAGEAEENVGRLKRMHDKTLIIFGSGILVQSLMKHHLVDELVLITHPLILSAGSRLFDSGVPFTKLKLANEVTTDTGVVISAYKVLST